MTAATLTLEKLVDTDAHEGPVYFADEDALYFTTVRRARVAIKRLDLRTRHLSVVRADANMANGMAADGEGRLVVCEQGTLETPARIARLDRATGEVETLAESYGGLPLNSPNDVVVKSDGTIWFTDPSYGHLQGFRPAPQLRDQVYRYDPASAEVERVADSFDKPNGLAFSPDEQLLYVSDNGEPHDVRAFDVVAGRALTNERLFAVATPGHPDGLKTDSQGRVYGSCAGGVEIWSADGDPLGDIELPGAVNFAFGGPRRDVLFITTDAAVWAAHTSAKGE